MSSYLLLPPNLNKHSVRRMPRQCNCFDYFQLEKEEIRLEDRKALTISSSFSVTSSQGVPFIHAGHTSHKGSKTTPITCQIVLTNWTDILPKCQEEIAFWRIDCLSEITLRLKKTKDYCDVKWLSDHHLIYTIEKDHMKNNDSCQYRWSRTDLSTSER